MRYRVNLLKFLKQEQLILENSKVLYALNKGQFFSRKMAFTLAEVLITVTIVGVVATMTIPNLISKIKEQRTVNTLIKTYSLVQQSYQFAKEEYGPTSGWGYNGNTVLSNLLVKVKTSVVCSPGVAESRKCGWFYPTKTINNGNYKWLNDRINSVASAQLLNGVTVSFAPHPAVAYSSESSAYAYGYFFVDTNGINTPNTLGKDIFMFYLTDVGLIPFGYSSDPWPFDKYCRKFEGYGCAAWVLSQKNMNYLHSSKCSWENTSCK